MKKTLSIAVTLLITVGLSACSQLPSFSAPVSDATTVSDKPVQTENAELQALKAQALQLQAFTYETANSRATAYFNKQQIVFIEVKEQQKIENIYLRNGRITTVVDNKQVYDLNKANLTNEELAVKKAAEKWVHKLSYNSADRNIAAVRTGDEAKLNYLCIAKLQQVAGTKKVLRTSANTAQSTSRLMATMRLNGNQFYQMDCVLAGDRIEKLSLMAK